MAGRGASVPGSGRAAGWTWRPITTGTAAAHLPGRQRIDVGQVEPIEDQLDAPSDEGDVDFLGVGEQRHGGGLGDRAGLGPRPPW